MADPKSSLLPDDDEARASAIEERIERLRRLKGWASDTRTVPSEQVEAIVSAVDGHEARPKPAQNTKLVLRWGGGQKVELTEQSTDIGTGDSCKVRVLDPSVASRHCRISRDGDGWRVRDLNTKTGTWVNSERIPLSSALTDGDELRCGDIVFNIQIASDAAPPKPAKAAPEPMNHTVVTSAAALLEAAAAKRAQQGVQAPPPASAPVARAPITGGRTPRSPSGMHNFQAAQPAPEARAQITGEPATCYVVYFDGEGTECEAEVPADRPLVVGRRATADLRMQDQGISSMHAAFEWVDGELVVRDLGSTNGTWVEGERVDRAVLHDQDIVRLGLVPVRVRFVAASEPAYEEPPEEDLIIDDGADDDVDDGAPVEAAPEEGPSPWHLVFLTDGGSVTSITVDRRQSCVVAGEGKNEISVYGRGLKPEHLQFDWSNGKLEVIQARKDALMKVNGKATAETQLQNGDIVSAGTLFIRVVRASGAKPGAARGPEAERWSQLFRAVDRDIELLFVDPDASTGGRSELSIWGDGTAQVEELTSASRERFAANLEPAFLKMLFGSIMQTGFPDLPSGAQRRAGARPELHAFCGDERAYAVLSDRLAASAPAWREVRDLLRAVVGQILG